MSILDIVAGALLALANPTTPPHAGVRPVRGAEQYADQAMRAQRRAEAAPVTRAVVSISTAAVGGKP